MFGATHRNSCRNMFSRLQIDLLHMNTFFLLTNFIVGNQENSK